MPLEHTWSVSNLYTATGHPNPPYRSTPHELLLPQPHQSLASLSLSSDPSTGEFKLAWSGATAPLDIAEGTLQVFVFGTERWCLKLKGWFPPSAAGEIRSGKTSTLPRDAQVRLSVRLASDSPAVPPLELEKAARLSVSITSPAPANVCFVFPRSSRRLYANETILRQASPYFEALFSSDFEEGKHSEEVDDILPPTSSASLTYAAPCMIVSVVDTAYSTYYALILWLLTGHLKFAPLRSNRGVSVGFLFGTPARTPHQLRLLLEVTKQPLLPPPVSCKSIYRLSHLLQLPSLSSLALTFYKTQLTPSNAAQELYSDFCGVYGEPKEVSMAFVVERWKEVEGSEGLKKVEERAARGEAGSEAARTAMELCSRLVKRYGT